MFTLPHELSTLAQGNPRALDALLFDAVSATLIEFGQNLPWLGGDIAVTLALHTWEQTLSQHLHLHGPNPDGALGANGQWIHARRGFLFPVQALSPVFRGKLLAGLTCAFERKVTRFAGSTAALAEPRERARWVNGLPAIPRVVYATQSLAGPEQVLDYLGRYTHRAAISNNRLVRVSDAEMRFRYKDYAHGNLRKLMTLAPQEFIRHRP